MKKQTIVENGKVRVIMAEEVKTVNKETVETNLVVDRKRIDVISHAKEASKITRPIYSIVPIIESIIIRVRRNEITKELEIYGEKCYSKGSNNPNAINLMHACGDFNPRPLEQVAIKQWNEKTKQFDDKYSVICNDIEAETKYIKTYTHTLIVYGMIDKDLRRLKATKDMVNRKKEYVNDINTCGLIEYNGEIKIAKNKEIPEGAKLYQVLNWSPSNLRNETQFFSCLKAAQAFNVLNTVSGDVLEEVFTAEKSIEALIKDSARVGILGAPSVPLAKSANDEFGYVVVLDEITGPYDYTEEVNQYLIDNGLEIDNNLWDGAAVYGLSWFIKAMAQLGVKLTKEQALYFAAQTRANKYFTKVFGEVKTDKNMKYRKDLICDMYDESQILRIKAGTDVTKLDRYQSILKANIIANKKLPINERLSEDEILNKTLVDLKKSYKVIIIGNENVIGSIIDTNGGKLLKNISLQSIVNGDITTYLLDIAKASNTCLSGQMVEKFLIADMDKTVEAVKERVDYNFNVDILNAAEGDIDETNCSLEQFMFRHVEEAKECEVVLEALISEKLKQCQSVVKKLKVDIDAFFQRALFDDCHFLTKGKIDGILGCNKYTHRLECYSRDIEEVYKEEINAIELDDTLSRDEKDEAIANLLTGAAFKYPSPSSDENALVTYVTSSQIRRKVDELLKDGVITKKEASMIKDDFLNTSYGVTKIGPDNTMKHKLAGMDTDYDGIAVVFETQLVDILLNKYQETDGLATIIC